MKLLTTQDFYALHAGTPPWIIDPLAVAGSMMLLYGRQGIGKSSLAWQLAFSLTTGAPWLGFPVLQTGKVVYLNLDMPRLELHRLMHRAAADAMPPSERILVLDIDQGEDFDVLRGRDGLVAACKPHDPIALIVDTVADGYLHREGDINAEARQVIRNFRAAAPGGLICLLAHDRKPSVMKTAAEVEADLNAFLGATAWEGKAATSVRLVRGKGGVHARFNKTRLERLPFETASLELSDNGFFSAKPTLVQALYSWQGEATQLKDVFEAVGKQLGQDTETVRRAYNRAVHRGVAFKWSDGISKSSSELGIGQA